MKKIVIIFFLSLLVISSGYAKQTNLDKLGIKGHVKEVKSTVYKLIRQGDGFKKEKQSSYCYKFNKDGLLIESIFYKADGSVEFGNRFIYNNQGDIIKTFSQNMDGSRSSETYKNTYDKAGNLVQIERYNQDKVMIYRIFKKYDNQGNLLEIIANKPNGKMESKEVYKYDGNFLIQEIEYNEAGTIEKNVTYKYNSKGINTEENYLDKAGNVISKYVYQYNKDGDKIGLVIYTQDGKVKSRSAYMLDKQGNITETVNQYQYWATSVVNVYEYY